MKFISLFSGIGGFDLGFERAGMECVAQVEIDKSALDVLGRQWPNVPKFNDVREFGNGQFDKGTVDLICGGFPCQDLSIAGKRKGLAGERSGLWFEFHRILDELAPHWVVIENVPGLLSSNGGRDFAVILRGLGELGYLSAWRVLDAQYFGVPQRRRRVFIVASLGSGRAAKVLFESEGLPGDTPPERTAGKAAPTLFASGAGTSRTASAGSESEFCIPVMFCADIAPTLKAEYFKKRYSNQQFLSQNGDAYPVVMAHGQAGAEIVKDGEPSLTLNHEAPIAFAWQQGVSENDRSYPIRAGDYAGSISETRVDAVSGSFGVRRLTPVECARLQGFPDDWNDWLADAQRYRQYGNAVAVPVAEWIGRRIMEAE
jgi:DNA (cytosine-5)-methyltransferase 1